MKPIHAIVCVIFFVSASVVFAQAPEPNALLFGAGGSGIVSVSYNRTFWESGKAGLSGNIGIGWMVFGFGINQGISVTYGKTHKLELGGVGILFVVNQFDLGILGPADDGLAVGYRVSPLIGYRRQKAEGV